MRVLSGDISWLYQWTCCGCGRTLEATESDLELFSFPPEQNTIAYLTCCVSRCGRRIGLRYEELPTELRVRINKRRGLYADAGKEEKR